MSTTVICPSCRVRLVVRETVRLPTLTCPRCLAMVSNPAMAGTAAPAVCPRCRRESAAGRTSCAFCGLRLAPREPDGDVLDLTHVPICTICAEESPDHAANCPSRPAARRGPARGVPSASREIQSDGDSTRVVALGLLGLVALGAFTTGRPLVAILVLVCGFSAVGRTPDGGKGSVLWTLIRVVAVLTFGFLVLAMLGFLALLIMCSSGGRPRF